jgi:DNA helicase-2/ATP-dependent DNA helicase PcrA
MELSEEQSDAVHHEGSAYVTACPGSGKTRALTEKLLIGMSKINSPSQKVLAVTYTNRAANEIESRAQQDERYSSKNLWVGTIHSFALEWIIRPYACYLEPLNNGFDVADEYETRKILSHLKEEKEMGYFDNINTTYDRSGQVYNRDNNAAEVEVAYRKILLQRKKVDFDQALYFAYKILQNKPEIASTLGAIFKLICIDEVQDTQDLQYAILSKIHNSSLIKPSLFIVGDSDQAIFEGIGGMSLNLDELKLEFAGSNLEPFTFSDNYRSTQRIADYFSHFRNKTGIKAKSVHSAQQGGIVFSNQEIDKSELPNEIAKIIQCELDSGVVDNEICIIAPQWSPIRLLSKKLITLLPNVKFDAPSLSPFNGSQDNFWLILAKLYLTTPSGRLFSTRVRWANEIIGGLCENFSKETNVGAKRILKIINSFKTVTVVGSDFLMEGFDHLLDSLKIDIAIDKNLSEARDIFFSKYLANIESNQDEYKDEINTLRSFFKESSGIVINSCHGVKGEEYETVIAFGLLKGYIPNWSDIYKSNKIANNAESKMMYVIASRAKTNLYLISESGRQTKSRNPLETSPLLANYNFSYD